MKVALTGGAYQARSVIAGAQRCVNLIPEPIPQNEGEPATLTHYPTPGTLGVAQYTQISPVRCLYTATNGQLYGVIGTAILTISPTWGLTVIGAIADGPNMVSMADNGVDLLIVDGTAAGYVVELGSNTITYLSDPAFYGADTVGVLDGFFCLNRPGSNQFYLSNNIATTFNSLYIVRKMQGDGIVAMCVTQRQLWVFGQQSTEIWADSGASDFPLQAVSGGIDHGCIAKYSVCRMNEHVFWLSQDREGCAVVLRGANYRAERISTHAIENTFQSYVRASKVISDAIGWTYQIDGHSIYVLTFPTANATWCYDDITGLWHEWKAPDGGRHCGISHAYAYGNHIVGDKANGALWQLNPDVYTDNGQLITRTRSFPHLISDAKRVQYLSLIADMETGTVPSGQLEPQLTLRWSDDRGASWSQPVTTGLGAAGMGITSLQFQRLGMARDRVFELSWTAGIPTALQGAWIETRIART